MLEPIGWDRAAGAALLQTTRAGMGLLVPRTSFCRTNNEATDVARDLVIGEFVEKPTSKFNRNGSTDWSNWTMLDYVGLCMAGGAPGLMQYTICCNMIRATLAGATVRGLARFG